MQRYDIYGKYGKPRADTLNNFLKDIRYIARSMCTCPDTKKGEMPLKDIPPFSYLRLVTVPALFADSYPVQDKGKFESRIFDAVVTTGGASMSRIHVHVQNQDVIVRLHRTKFSYILRRLVEQHL